MTPFVKNFLVNTIKGMLVSLKGCDHPTKIEIHIED